MNEQERLNEPIRAAESGSTVEEIGESQHRLSIQVAERLRQGGMVSPELVEASLRNPTQLVSRLSPNVLRGLPGSAKEAWNLASVYAEDLGVSVPTTEIDPEISPSLQAHLRQEAAMDNVQKAINGLYELAANGSC